MAVHEFELDALSQTGEQGWAMSAGLLGQAVPRH